MKAFVTGPLGFLGSHLVDRLIEDGHAVTGFDSGVTGNHKFCNNGAEYVSGDVRDLGAVTAAMKGIDTVFHLCAVADIRDNWQDPDRIFRVNTLGTQNVLEAMRLCGVKRIAFASSDAVYGNAGSEPLAENCPWPMQTSLYGASKVAGETLVQAYAAGQGFTAYIFRFCPIVGERYTHGHVFDFVKRLLADPTKLEMKGDGNARKCKVYVKDAVSAMLHVMTAKLWNCDANNIYNVVANDPKSVNESLAWICDEMKVTPQIQRPFTINVGYPDVLWPHGGKLRATGWEPTISTEEGVRRTVRWLLENRWALERK